MAFPWGYLSKYHSAVGNKELLDALPSGLGLHRPEHLSFPFSNALITHQCLNEQTNKCGPGHKGQILVRNIALGITRSWCPGAKRGVISSSFFPLAVT